MDVVAFACRAVLVLVFGVAAVGKIVDRQGAQRALGEFRVPQPLVVPVSWLLPAAETCIAVALLVQPLARAAAVGAAILLALFMSGIASAMLRGEAPDCNCFGQVGSKPAGKGTLARNTALAALAVFVAIYGGGVDPGSWLKPRTGPEIAVLVLVAFAVALAATLAGLVNERRVLRADLATAQTALDLFPPPPGLPVGVEAPTFALPSVTGEKVTLSELVGLGRPVALVFVSPSCRPCHHMFPDISRWQQTLSDRLTITLLVHGTRDEARELSQGFGLANVLSDLKATVFHDYRGQGTPSMVIITPEGKVGIRIRSSHGAVEAAIRRALQEAPAADLDHQHAGVGNAVIDIKRWPDRDAQPA